MPTALVTGATRGVGKGVATALHAAGYRVFATGRTIESADLPSGIIRIPCNHVDDDQTEAAFERIAAHERGENAVAALDLVVNNSWGGYAQMMEDGKFTWSLPFGSSRLTAGRR
jgi:NAD(P)-dependent dehydrogenase (short-subunit alcohol dehydrogenase family)